MRRASVADIADLVAMGSKFHEAVKPEWELSEVGLAWTLRALVQSGYVARTEQGFIAGTIAPNPIAVDWLVASEFLWWSEDGEGARLARGFREWAKDAGANEIRWSCPPDNERVKRVYARRAKQTEIIYSECLSCA